MFEIYLVKETSKSELVLHKTPISHVQTFCNQKLEEGQNNLTGKGENPIKERNSNSYCRYNSTTTRYETDVAKRFIINYGFF